MTVEREKQKSILDLYKYEGGKNIKIIRKLDSGGNFFLVSFEHHGKEFRSICSYCDLDSCASIYYTTLPKYEDALVADWEAEYGECEEVEGDDEEEQITEVEKEYEIQSDLDAEDYFGKSIDDYANMVDNVDFGRWLDDHGAEMYEH